MFWLSASSGFPRVNDRLAATVFVEWKPGLRGVLCGVTLMLCGVSGVAPGAIRGTVSVTEIKTQLSLSSLVSHFLLSFNKSQ